MKRTATAVWNGSGKDGKGSLTTQSTTLNKTQYSYKSRFEDGVGTNPEELVAAAHAGCFAMKLSFVLQESGAICVIDVPIDRIQRKNGVASSSNGPGRDV